MRSDTWTKAIKLELNAHYDKYEMQHLKSYEHIEMQFFQNPSSDLA